jgi:hypothetical protein
MYMHANLSVPYSLANINVGDMGANDTSMHAYIHGYTDRNFKYMYIYE